MHCKKVRNEKVINERIISLRDIFVQTSSLLNKLKTGYHDNRQLEQTTAKLSEAQDVIGKLRERCAELQITIDKMVSFLICYFNSHNY